MNDIKSLLSESFIGPFNSIDEVWTKRLSVNHGSVAGLVFVAFAEDIIFVYNSVVYLVAGKHMEGKLDLFLKAAQKYCSAKVDKQHKRSIGIIWNNQKSLGETKKTISKSLG